MGVEDGEGMPGGDRSGAADPPGPWLELDLRARAGAFELRAALRVQGTLALVGANGAGKTTLLRALAGLVPATGRLRLGELVWLDDARATPPEARGVGYMPQGAGLFPHLRVRDNVRYGRRDADVGALLSAVGAPELADRWPRTLSGGEAQRVALARALATRPRLLLLDEPTAAVDVAARPALRALLGVELAAGRPAVVVTHDLRDLLAWSPTVALIERGAVAAVGSLHALRRHPHPFLRELLGPLQS